jgi:AcrR family transcriptional regulator
MMKKGEMTRVAILDAALQLAATDGLDGITIGMLAERLGMSKSGVFAHFGSREDLQITVLKTYEERFALAVLKPALAQARGLPRLRAIVNNWLEHSALEAQTGCIWISGASEFDDKPGAIRDLLVAMVKQWQSELSRAIVQACELGQLRSDLDTEQMVFEIYGLILVLHHDARLLKSANAMTRARESMERLFNSYSSIAETSKKAA